MMRWRRRENKMKTIEVRKQEIILTDPQRRVYNGCAYSSETVLLEWEVLESEIPDEKADERLAFWIDLNNYAVSQRGEGSRKWFRLVPC